MLAQLREAGGSRASEPRRELIGQFGVGFYSSFMVADRVELVTRGRASHAGVRWESTGEGTYTIADGPDAPQGTAVTPAPQARGHRRRAARLRRTRRRSGRSSSATRTSSPGRSAWRRPHDRRTTDARDRPQLAKALWARAQKDGLATRSTPSSTATSATTGASRWRPSGWRPRARSSTRPCCSCRPRPDGPVLARGQARRAALRQARVHHGRLRGARPRVPAVRQGRRRRARPLAQHLPRDPPAGPPDPADPQAAGQEGAVDGEDHAWPKEPEKYAHVLDRVGPGRQGGPALRPRQPRSHPRDLLVRLHARRRASRRRCATTSRA